MPRPKCPRWIGSTPASVYFKPRGIPMAKLEEVSLSVDELEALRLADLEGLYQEQAAEQMLVSRQTFGRIVAAARHKVAAALLGGQALRIDTASVDLETFRKFECSDCRHSWQRRAGKPRPTSCPACDSRDIAWADAHTPGRPQRTEERSRLGELP